LWDLADYPELVELQGRLEGRPVGQVRETYAQYRQKLERTVAFQDRMLKASGNLDVLLADTPMEQVIPFSATDSATVAEMIARRTISTVQLRFHQALNLADMALHLDTSVGQHRIARYRDDLAGLALRNAAGAHGELDFANLSMEDRISILQEAWDEYAAALLNCKRIRDEGGELIEVDMLDWKGSSSMQARVLPMRSRSKRVAVWCQGVLPMPQRTSASMWCETPKGRF
jgi:hypothetical protein